MAGCNVVSAIKAADTCKPSMAGTGDKAYFFDKAEWLKRISTEGATGITTKSLPVPGKNGKLEVDETGQPDAEAKAKMLLLKNFLYKADIKIDSGQVTSESAEGNEANMQKVLFVVDGNVDAFNELAHSLNLIDFGAIIPRVGGGYYVVYSPYKRTQLNNAYDSGTTWDSDHGFTAQVSASPCDYAYTFWEPEDDLDTWVATA